MYFQRLLLLAPRSKKEPLLGLAAFKGQGCVANPNLNSKKKKKKNAARKS